MLELGKVTRNDVEKVKELRDTELDASAIAKELAKVRAHVYRMLEI